MPNQTALRIRLLRSQKKLTQEALAEQINANRVTISHYESGAYNPSHDAILKMAKVFDVSSDYLLGRTDDPRRTPNLVTEEENNGQSVISDEDIKFALFDGAKDVTDEQFEEVKQFAKAILTRDRFKNR